MRGSDRLRATCCRRRENRVGDGLVHDLTRARPECGSGLARKWL